MTLRSFRGTVPQMLLAGLNIAERGIEIQVGTVQAPEVLDNIEVAIEKLLAAPFWFDPDLVYGVLPVVVEPFVNIVVIREGIFA